MEDSPLIDLDQISPEELVKSEHLAEYKQAMEYFYLALVRLNANLFILDRVLSFPFDLFIRAGKYTFFILVIENFIDISLLMITRLAKDSGPNTYTLPQFKNSLQTMLKEQYVDAFRSRVREVEFDKETNKLLERARNIRKQRVAHVLRDVVFKVTKVERVAFGELKSIYASLDQMFHTLAFSQDYLMLPIQYAPDVGHLPGVDSRPDIEKTLDLMARESHLLNLPESNPVVWQFRRNQLSEDKIQILNEYRRKFGLPEV